MLPQTHEGLQVDYNKLPLVGVTYPPDTSAGWEEETRFSGIFFNMALGGEQLVNEALGASTSHLMHASQDVGSADILNTVVDISTTGLSLPSIPSCVEGRNIIQPAVRRVFINDQRYPQEVLDALSGDTKVLWNLGDEPVWWRARIHEKQLNLTYRRGDLREYSAGVPKNCFLLSYAPRGIYAAERYYSFLNWEDRVIVHPMRNGVFATHFKVPEDDGYSSNESKSADVPGEENESDVLILIM